MLVETGLTQEQAEAYLEILEETLKEDVATKEDIRNLESRLIAEIRHLELKNDD